MIIKIKKTNCRILGENAGRFVSIYGIKCLSEEWWSTWWYHNLLVPQRLKAE